MPKYNVTQLDPDKNFERHVYHRDMFAHYLRWTHVLKRLKVGMNVLDFGCGSGNLFEVIYRNRFKANKYLGLDYRKKIIDKNNDLFNGIEWCEFKQQDLTLDSFNFGNDWDIIASFEVIEHVGKNNVDNYLQNINKHMNEKTIFLISTPCFDEKVGAAQNHIIDGQVCELTYDELYEKLEINGFEIVNTWGTFASQTDYVKYLNPSQLEFYNSVKDYFDVNILSNLMAPLFPNKSRNCLWECKLKNKLKNFIT